MYGENAGRSEVGSNHRSVMIIECTGQIHRTVWGSLKARLNACQLPEKLSSVENSRTALPLFRIPNSIAGLWNILWPTI